ncbi:Hypothetical predicted protein [Pelobates cultripes]|uniref:Uncharacterized protein n=1 Tax=Pelobates cultripes TaxID=61616 RepID=A0AAD1RLN4_PELCU|nr:Hypothetical predicted protein [Pelobates cultripes]
MEETQIYNQRLHGITEKRGILIQVENIQRELEQQRLKLLQLKRKSLRDRWLMEGLGSAQEAENESPLTQTEGKIHQLQQELESLQSRLFHLENPGIKDIKTESTKVTPTPEIHLVNGDQEQNISKSTEDHKDDSSLLNVHNENKSASGRPIPAPRANRADTPEKKQNHDAHNDDKQSEIYEKQNVEILDQSQEDPAKGQKHHNFGQMDKNVEFQEHAIDNQNERLPDESQEHQNQSEKHFNPGDIMHSALSNTEEVDEMHNPSAKLLAQSQESGIMSGHQTPDHKPTAVPSEISDVAIVTTEYKSQDQNDKSASTINNHVEESVPSDNNQEIDQNQEFMSVNLDQKHDDTTKTKDQNADLHAFIQDQNLVIQSPNENQIQELKSSSQDHYLDPVSETQDLNQECTSSTKDQNQNPALTTQDQDYKLLTQDQSQEPASITPTLVLTNDQNNEHIPVTQDQNQELILPAQDQNQGQITELVSYDHAQIQDLTLPDQDQSRKISPPRKDQNEDYFPFSEDQKPSTVLQSKNLVHETQAHISHVVVVAAPAHNTPDSGQGQHSSNSQQVSSAAIYPLEDRPLLKKDEKLNASSNTAESQREKARVKEKTCQCCVVM